MSSYTITLRGMMDLYTEGEGYGNERDKIELGRTKLFDFDYPIFDETYRKEFETHFIRKFYMREIGYETEGLFKFNLETWLLINMPFYNKLFQSELITFDPLTNYKQDVTKTKKNDKTNAIDGSSHANTTQSNTGNLTENEFNRELESNNPDSRLQLTSNNGQGVIEYASAIREDSQNNTKNSSSSGTGNTNESSSVTSNGTENEDVTESRTGKTGDVTYSKMLNEYRDSILRIENKCFSEMNDLFMLVY